MTVFHVLAATQCLPHSPADRVASARFPSNDHKNAERRVVAPFVVPHVVAQRLDVVELLQGPPALIEMLRLDFGAPYITVTGQACVKALGITATLVGSMPAWSRSLMYRDDACRKVETAIIRTVDSQGDIGGIGPRPKSDSGALSGARVTHCAEG